MPSTALSAQATVVNKLMLKGGRGQKVYMWHEHECVKNKKLPGVKRLEENRPRYQL